MNTFKNTSSAQLCYLEGADEAVYIYTDFINVTKLIDKERLSASRKDDRYSLKKIYQNVF